MDAALAMVLREAATNVQRHAGARRVGVVLTRARERVRLCIEDDGRGGIEREGNGLIGMRERLAALGGILQIDSAPGRGTRLCAELGCPPAGSGLAEGALTPGSLCAAAAVPGQVAIATQGADSAVVGSARRGGG
jgi:two-component system sensor histidine kinase DesK